MSATRGLPAISMLRYVGLAGLVASLSVLSGSIGPFATALPGQRLAWDYLIAFLVAASALSLLLPLASKRVSLIEKKSSLVLAGVLAAAGPLMTLGALALPSPAALIILGAVLAGAGNALLGLIWGHAFAQLDSQRIIGYTAVSVGLAAAVQFGIAHVPSAEARLVLIALLPIVSAAAVWPLSSRTASLAEPGEPGQGIFRSVGRDVWRPLVGAGLCALISGLTWDAAAAGVETTATWQHGVRVASTMLLAAVMAFAVARGRRKLTAAVLYRVALPIAAAVLLVVPFIHWENALWQFTSSVASSVGSPFFEIAVWSALAMAVRTSGLSAPAIFGPARAILFGIMVLGLLIFPLIGLGGQIVCLLLITLYLVAMTVTIPNRERTNAPAASDLEGMLTSRCAVLSQKHGLSNRESEIFTFLGRGHSPVFIARELGISENTVRTHVRRIHDKLDIHSREELIALIDSADLNEVDASSA
ncbi:MAG: response regulator transcription factor [Coriobacteriia bacterium]